MYSGMDLRTEIREVIDKTIESGLRVRTAWITTEVCNGHPEIFGDDAEFWRLAGIAGIQQEVRRMNSSIKSDQEDESKQGSLPFAMPGYRYLQKVYFVSDSSNPEEGPVGVPLTEMNDEQIHTKADEYRKMAAGCVAHADELERYLNNRRAA